MELSNFQMSQIDDAQINISCDVTIFIVTNVFKLGIVFMLVVTQAMADTSDLEQFVQDLRCKTIN